MRYSGVSLYLTCLLPFFLFQVHLYQLLDVYLLGDIFTDFRKDSLEVFQLEVRFVFERDAWLLYLSLLYLHFCSFFISLVATVLSLLSQWMRFWSKQTFPSNSLVIQISIYFSRTISEVWMALWSRNFEIWDKTENSLKKKSLKLTLFGKNKKKKWFFYFCFIFSFFWTIVQWFSICSLQAVSFFAHPVLLDPSITKDFLDTNQRVQKKWYISSMLTIYVRPNAHARTY